MDPNKPKSPNLLAALQNPYLKTVSYTLPDGTIIIDPRKPLTPDLSKVSKCTIITVMVSLTCLKIKLLKMKTPELRGLFTQALTNESIRSASYQLPDGSLVIPGQKPSSPNLTAALRQNQGMRSSGIFQLSKTSGLTGAPKPSTPKIASALKKEDLKGVNFR